MNHDVFISYSSQDKVAAQAICHALEQNGIRCWIAPRDIPPGAEYGDLIDDAIKESTVVVILFSETAAASSWVKGELNVAFEEQKVIIPFRLDETPLKGQHRVILNQKHWIDAYPDYETKFSDLINAVSNAIGKEDRKPIETNIQAPSKDKQQKTKWKNWGFYIVPILVVVAGLIFGQISFTSEKLEYNREGLHLTMEDVTDIKKSALISILDNMVFVEGGQFMMGNNYEFCDYLTEQDSLSINPHWVKLDNFYIGKYELTQKEWKAFMSLEGRCIIENEDNKAMDMLSWEDAMAFADTLTQITGLSFSLPTEAQWEYAAKGGKESRGYLFSGHEENPCEVGWTSADNLSAAHDVGGKRYNELGLYDMTGNVSEWCLDNFDYYESTSAINPQGPSIGKNKIHRGGDFRTVNLYDLKVTTRHHASPFVNRRGTGLRLVINIK